MYGFVNYTLATLVTLCSSIHLLVIGIIFKNYYMIGGGLAGLAGGCFVLGGIMIDQCKKNTRYDAILPV